MEKIRVDALVIGGGIAGMQSALDLADQGYQVALVERQPSIGGKMIALSKVFPTLDCCSCITTPKMSAVAHHENIQLFTYFEVRSVEEDEAGFLAEIVKKPRYVKVEDCTGCRQCEYVCPVLLPNPFDMHLGAYRAVRVPFSTAVPQKAVLDIDNCLFCGKCEKICPVDAIDFTQKAEIFHLAATTILLATGFELTPRDAKKEYGADHIQNVIDGLVMERLLAPTGPYGRVICPGDGKELESIAYVQCAGSRDQTLGIEYCSRVCCTANLHMAVELRERFPQVNVFDLYEDIRTYGRGHETYYREALQKMVRFLRFHGDDRPEVFAAPKGDSHPVLVQVRDHLTWGRKLEIPVDLVVLAVGFMPRPVDDLIEKLKISPGTDRFLLEVHPKLRPVETAVPGVILAGTAQGPMNIQETVAAAKAAAAKVGTLLAAGEVELEPFVARVDPEKCDGSGACVEVCEYEDAIALETLVVDGRQVKRAVVTPANCSGCGNCVSACPNRAVDVQGWTLKQYEAMVDAITMEIPDFMEMEA